MIGEKLQLLFFDALPVGVEVPRIVPLVGVVLEELEQSRSRNDFIEIHHCIYIVTYLWDGSRFLTAPTLLFPGLSIILELLVLRLREEKSSCEQKKKFETNAVCSKQMLIQIPHPHMLPYVENPSTHYA